MDSMTCRVNVATTSDACADAEHGMHARHAVDAVARVSLDMAG